MSVKNRLVELLREADSKATRTCSMMETCPECPGYGNGVNCQTVLKANYLIQNGVTIVEKPTRPEPNLDGKCGSCAYAVPSPNMFGGSDCWVKCTNREHLAKYSLQGASTIRQRTCKGCKRYRKRVAEVPDGE